MKKKLILFNTLITSVALILMFILGILVSRNNNYEQATNYIISLTNAYANNYSTNAKYTKEIDKDIRITVIDISGKVIADSSGTDLSSFENHNTRAEVVDAINNKPTVYKRKSSTTGKEMMYYALKVNTESDYVIVRIAMELNSINNFVADTVPLMLVIFCLSLAASIVLSVVLSSRALKPLNTVKEGLKSINNGTYEPVLPTTDEDDINKMLSDINNIESKIQDIITETSCEKAKLDYIFNNVSDGIVVFNKDTTIEMINEKALQIFNVKQEVTGKETVFLGCEDSFNKIVNECVKENKTSVFDFNKDAKNYLCAINGTENSLAILVIADITATKNNEKLRSDFFANASHELKTPLTSIKGFNELMLLQNKDEQLKPFIEKIAKEVDRMLMLIDDMLKLSNLENCKQIEKEDVDILEVAEEVKSSLEHLSNEKGVSINIEGKGNLKAERKHIYELIRNLVENGIKYNEKGGKVTVSILEGKVFASIKVADNGIGIAPSKQGRLFERFYRVEKSRSRETGGTGLGLAIVKHIAELYKADLNLTSKLNEGTTITIAFKK